MPVTVPYASRTTETGAEPPNRIRTAIAAVWLIAITWAAHSAFWDFFADQARLADIFHRVYIVFTLSIFSVATHASSGPLLYAFCVGGVAAAALWHWPQSRLRWIALLPIAAGAWQLTAPVDFYRSSGPSTSMNLILATVLQAAIVYVGTQTGRRLIRRLAMLLLPPNLSAALTPMWSRP